MRKEPTPTARTMRKGKVPTKSKPNPANLVEGVRTAVTRRKRRGSSAYARRKKKKGLRFEEFLATNPTLPFQKNGLVTVPKVEGIHSQGWVDSILTQHNSGFLKLPLELRNRIYILAFTSLVNDNRSAREGYREVLITPSKHGRRYINLTPFSSHCANGIDRDGRQKCEIIKLYNFLGSVSRQVYLEVIGSGLLYGLSTFQFMSRYLMDNYINFINPRLADLIVNITLQLKATFRMPNPFLPSLFRSLAALSSLRNLEIRLVVAGALYQRTYQQAGYGSIYQEVLNRWDQARWEMLGGKGLRELCIKVRSTLRLELRDENSHAWIERARRRIGGDCGGDSDEAAGTRMRKALRNEPAMLGNWDEDEDL